MLKGSPVTGTPLSLRFKEFTYFSTDSNYGQLIPLDVDNKKDISLE